MAGSIWEVKPSVTVADFAAHLNTVVVCQATSQGGLRIHITNPAASGKKQFVRCILYTLPTQANKIDPKLVVFGKLPAVRATQQRSRTAVFTIPAPEIPNTLLVMEYTEGEKDGMTISHFTTLPCSSLKPFTTPNKSL